MDGFYDIWVPLGDVVGRPNLSVVPQSKVRVADLIDFNKGESDVMCCLIGLRRIWLLLFYLFLCLLVSLLINLISGLIKWCLLC